MKSIALVNLFGFAAFLTLMAVSSQLWLDPLTPLVVGLVGIALPMVIAVALMEPGFRKLKVDIVALTAASALFLGVALPGLWFKGEFRIHAVVLSTPKNIELVLDDPHLPIQEAACARAFELNLSVDEIVRLIQTKPAIVSSCLDRPDVGTIPRRLASQWRSALNSGTSCDLTGPLKTLDSLAAEERAIELLDCAIQAEQPEVRKCCTLSVPEVLKGGSADILKQKRESPTPSEVTELSKKVDQAAGKVSNCGDTEESCSLTRGRYRAGMSEMEALKAAVDEQPHLRRCPIMKKAAQFGVEASKDDFTERVRGFQSLDAQYDKERNITHVSATWSDTEFDARKTKPNRFGHLEEKNVVSRLPLCETCTRTWDFGGNGNESNYSVGQITAPMTVRSTADYYTRKLTEQGWQVSEAQIAINELYCLSGKPDDGNRWLRVVRGKEHMSVHISPRAGGGSRVTATSAN